MAKSPANNTANQNPWIRLPYMLLFVLIANIVELMVLVTMIVQFIVRLCTGSVNRQLQMLGQSLGAYIQAIIVFLTYHTDIIPYPFGPWVYGTEASQEDV
jgi:hypothetical protein